MSAHSNRRKQQQKTFTLEIAETPHDLDCGESGNLAAIFTRYRVKQRRDNGEVEHAATHVKTILTPYQFMLFEAALKAQYLSWAIPQPDNRIIKIMGQSQLDQMLGYTRSIIQRNDIAIPAIPTDLQPRQAAADYHRLCQTIRSEQVAIVGGGSMNMYMAVLD